ncbi:MULTISPECIES: LacI family DNA-binding transcriptional regulator [unclassified Crossiella]|uniref:LacI family DNA-binding transcriptional regulator n=1 Tax=unclassified Crossiella TaxID=2620835 RepID=UPI001FFFD360|nr:MULTISPECIES: LacI family DNA-binding transcriptional regulator [unclassified Crossiella]MCK2243553.1 LacI family transcriptional regulator [Crossiella sp. S99.2]MCK2257411.1 LacI family transcriptional regulator [Crossiella sp. S99.1]
MATISDVAARAGVSTATVSRALNGKSTVDPELASRVRAAAKELGYRPNGLARNLRRQETAVLALIISDVENPFFTAIARGVEDTAQAGGYQVVLCNSDENADKERRYVEVALSERAAGVIVSPSGLPGSLDPLFDSGTPVVAVDRRMPDRSCDMVLVHSRLAARQATEHLIEQGYQRIACLTGPEGVPTADDRAAGYRDALVGTGRRELLRRAEYRAPGAQVAASELLGGPERPDAMLVGNSAMAVGVLAAMRAHGLRAGIDLGLVSFDDAPWTTLLEPQLSVVAQPAYQIGVQATRLLLARIADPGRLPSTVTLDARLIPRGSSTRSPGSP